MIKSDNMPERVFPRERSLRHGCLFVFEWEGKFYGSTEETACTKLHPVEVVDRDGQVIDTVVLYGWQENIYVPTTVQYFHRPLKEGEPRVQAFELPKGYEHHPKSRSFFTDHVSFFEHDKVRYAVNVWGNLGRPIRLPNGKVHNAQWTRDRSRGAPYRVWIGRRKWFNRGPFAQAEYAHIVVVP